MSAAVKRGYRSSLRAAQADQTRRSIVAAASRLFIENGYGATTLDAVADAAGVSRKTVFTAIGGKLALLKTALDWAVVGDDQPVALADRTALRQLLEHPDPAVLIDGWVQMLVQIDTRLAALYRALEVAAGVDPEAGVLLERATCQRLDGARTVVARLAALGALRPGLTAEKAADLAWLAGDPVLYDRMVRQRGWSTGRFEQWLAESLRSGLIIR